MIPAAKQALLVAQSSRLDDMARRLADGFRPDGGRPETGSYVVIASLLIGLAVALWLLARAAGRGQRRLARNSPRHLFVSLCRAHGLKRADRKLLRRLARQCQLQDPARLFVEPDWFVQAASSLAWQQGAERLEAVRRRLFEGLGAPDPVPAQSEVPGAGPVLSDPFGGEGLPLDAEIASTSR